MGIHVTCAPTVPLTSYDTKRSSHLKGPKIKDEFVNQPLLTNDYGFIYKKRFCENQKFHFPSTN